MRTQNNRNYNRICFFFLRKEGIQFECWRNCWAWRNWILALYRPCKPKQHYPASEKTILNRRIRVIKPRDECAGNVVVLRILGVIGQLGQRTISEFINICGCVNDKEDNTNNDAQSNHWRDYGLIFVTWSAYWPLFGKDIFSAVKLEVS